MGFIGFISQFPLDIKTQPLYREFVIQATDDQNPLSMMK
jgi:hypothetical protein